MNSNLISLKKIFNINIVLYPHVFRLFRLSSTTTGHKILHYTCILLIHTSTKLVCLASLTVTTAWTSSINFCFSSSSNCMYHLASRVFPARFWMRIKRIYVMGGKKGKRHLWLIRNSCKNCQKCPTYWKLLFLSLTINCIYIYPVFTSNYTATNGVINRVALALAHCFDNANWTPPILWHHCCVKSLT